MTIYYSKVTSGGGVPVAPRKSHPEDAGWDLFVSRPVTMAQTERTKNIPTDIKVAIPEGWFGLLVGRSSTPRRFGLNVITAVIDAGYRGELFIQVERVAGVPKDDIVIEMGSRIAQLLILPVPALPWQELTDLPPSQRGSGGFGSTGG